MGTLDVEEKARAKDTHGKGVESSSANMVQKKKQFAFYNKKNNKQENKQGTNPKPKQTTTFKKKKADGGCFVYGSDDHWTSACPDDKFKREEKKSVNMVISEAEGGTSGYGNYLPTVLSVFHSPEWWMDTRATVHVCADISLFSSYQVGDTGALLMGTGSHVRVLGVGTVILKFTSGKTVLMKNVQHAPSIKKNLVNVSQFCRDGYKIVFKANKVIL